MSASFRYLFPKGVDWAVKKSELSFYHEKRTYKFNKEIVLLTIVSLIEKKKLIQPIFAQPNAVLAKLLQLGLVHVQLLSGTRPVLEMNFFPNLKEKFDPRRSKSGHGQFLVELAGKQLILKDPGLQKKLVFIDKADFFNVFENRNGKAIDTHRIVRQILNSPDFMKPRGAQAGWDYHDFVFHNQTGISNPNFNLQKKETTNSSRKSIVNLEKQTQTLISRRSHRDFSDKPIKFAKLSRLFWQIGKKSPYKHSFYGNHYKGNYPSAGGAYENEFYLLAGNCEGLAQGLYRYDGLRHELINLNITKGDLISLKLEAESKVGYRGARAANAIIVTSKISLLQKKYSKVAYRLALLNAGVIIGYLDFYINEMKLGGCPAGSIDWKAFAQIVNQDGYKEFAVAEYLLGEIKNSVEPRKY